MWMKYIEYPMGMKHGTLHRMVRRKYKLGRDKLLTVAQQRQKNAREYRICAGKAMIWPPFKEQK